MSQRCADALGKALRSERGQALVELPFVVVLVCVLSLVLLQPLVQLYTKMVLGQVAAGLCRVVATQGEEVAGTQQVLLSAYAADKLEGLPKGSAFYQPGSLRVEVSGAAHTERIEVQVSVRQTPLPLIGFLWGGKGRGSTTVTGRASATGAWRGVSGTPESAPQTFGFDSGN
jgi:Tfp pilus assembly protein PilE